MPSRCPSNGEIMRTHKLPTKTAVVTSATRLFARLAKRLLIPENFLPHKRGDSREFCRHDDSSPKKTRRMSPACQWNALSEALKNVVELLSGGVA